jgi:hypothetical protein
MDDVCASCGRLLTNCADGVSSVYSPDQQFMLCEPCWLEEDAEIEARGTNDLPERIHQYRQTLENW